MPEGLKQDFKTELKRYEQEKQMPYVTSIEQMGIEEGREQGLQRQRSMFLRLLNRKLGVLPESAIAEVSLLSVDQLDELAEELLDFKSVNELENWLRNLE